LASQLQFLNFSENFYSVKKLSLCQQSYFPSKFVCFYLVIEIPCRSQMMLMLQYLHRTNRSDRLPKMNVNICYLDIWWGKFTPFIVLRGKKRSEERFSFFFLITLSNGIHWIFVKKDNPPQRETKGTRKT